MKSNKAVPAYAAHVKTRALIKALLLGLVAFNRNGKGQDVLAPSPQPPDQTPAALQAARPDQMNVFASDEIQREAQPFTWEGLTLRPHPFYQFQYADGLQYGTNQVAHSTIQNISIGALLEIGSHWTLDYTPSWTIYSNNHFQNNFGQSVQLAGGTVYNDWIFGVSQNYTDSHTVSAETATQVHAQTGLTTADATYSMNSKMSLDLAADQYFIIADQFNNYLEWATMDWLNYEFWPRFSAAIGVGAGYDHEESSDPEIAFQQIEARLKWRVADKVSLQAHGGLDIREFLSGGASDLINPIFDLTIQYQPFDQTKITLLGARVVEPSLLPDQVNEITRISLELNQRLLGRIFLDMTGGYEWRKYVFSVPASVSTPAFLTARSDNYDYLNVGLSTAFLKRGTFGIFYQISRDDSSQTGYSFTSHQVGFQIGFRY